MEASDLSPDRLYPRWRLLLPVLFLMGTLAWASACARTPPAAPNIFQFDKIAHFCVFGLMGTLCFRVPRLPARTARRWLAAFGAVMAYALLDEVLQYFNPARSFDPFDWLADLTGCLVGIFMYRGWAAYRGLLEFQLRLPLAKRRGDPSNPPA